MKLLVYTTSLSSTYIADACQIISNKKKKIKFAFIIKKKKIYKSRKKKFRIFKK